MDYPAWKDEFGEGVPLPSRGRRTVLMMIACVLGCLLAGPLQAGPDPAPTVVQSARPTPAEAFAADELAGFLRRVTGKESPRAAEPDFKGGPAIYVGQTDFAARRGVDVARLDPEEWVIRSVDGALLVSGGRPRGTLYAVYEFVEAVLGVRFLAAHAEHVPSNPRWILPANQDLRGRPAFSRREVFMVAGGAGSPEFLRFQVRRKLNGFNNATSSDPKLGGGLLFGSPYSTHTHSHYTKDFPAGHPEYFALLGDGSRRGPGPDGQVCMSHPEVRRLFADRLRGYIRKDRERAAPGEGPPTLYSLAPNDNMNVCLCPGCRELEKKYGAYTGVLMDFTNAVAAEIARDFPEVRIITAAYTFAMAVPRGLRPRDNVVVYIAQLGSEFNSPPLRDTLRGMDHPLNADARRLLEAWAGVSPALGVHDYWTPWNQPFQWPHANVRGLARTLKYYHDRGVRHVFVEDELFGSRIHNFVDLQLYLASRFLQDPQLDAEAVIAEFTDLYYGPAAAPMRKLLDLLERRPEEEPGRLPSVPPAARTYFDPAFFTEADARLREAEQAVAGDPRRLADVLQERLAFDETLLHLWEPLRAARPLPFRREAVLDRLRLQYEAARKKYGGWGEERRKEDDVRLDYLRNLPPVPAEFAKKKIIDLCGPLLELSRGGGGFAKSVPDKDAATGRAWTLDASAPGGHERPPALGLYDEKLKKAAEQVIPEDRRPRDEKYHFHFAGRMKGSANLYFWAHSSWRLGQPLGATYNAALPEQKAYDVYASAKLEGPAYVPGSTRQNAFSVDRLILVEVVD